MLFLAAPILIGGLGIGIERIVLRPLGYKPENTIIATIGVLFIIQHSALLIFGPAPRNVLAPFDFVVQMPGFGYSGYRIIVSAISVVLLVTVWTLVHKTRFGLYVRACQQNQEVATTLGIPVNRVFMLAFGLSSALAALGSRYLSATSLGPLSCRPRHPHNIIHRGDRRWAGQP